MGKLFFLFFAEVEGSAAVNVKEQRGCVGQRGNAGGQFVCPAGEGRTEEREL